MKRSTKTRSLIPYIILIGILLPVLAALQYHWLNQMSEAEKQRMMFNLGYASYFTADLVDRVVAQASEAFDIPVASQADAVQKLNQQLRKWNTEHEDPALVHSVLWLERLQDGDWNAFSMSPGREPLAIVSNLEKASLIPAPSLLAVGGLDCGSEPALIIPARQETSSGERGEKLKGRYVVVRFDSDYLFDIYLPSLLRFYFELEEPETYRAAIVTDSEPHQLLAGSPDLSLDNADVAVKFFSLRARERLQADYSGGMFSGTIAERVAAAEQFFEESGQNESEEEQMAWGEGCWIVVASHRSGTLDAVVTRVRNHNLGISFSVFVLLAASTIVVAMLSQRSRKLAEQQIEFVAGVSHELRTPLAVIRSAGENLADSVVGEPDRVKKYGAIIRNEGQRLTAMVENVLQFSRVQPSQNGYDLRPVELLTCIDAALEACHRQIESSGSTVELEIDETLPEVLAAPAALTSVLQNLIANAAKHGATGQTITISVRRKQTDKGDVVKIDVSDQGPGIRDDELSHVFEPFFRGARARDEQIEGSGLGLSVVRQVMAGHGGEVSVSSQPGAGTTFTLTLPLHDDEHD